MTTLASIRFEDEIVPILTGLEGLLVELGLTLDCDGSEQQNVTDGLLLLAAITNKASRLVDHFGDPALTAALTPSLAGIQGLLAQFGMATEKYRDPAHLKTGLYLLAGQVGEVCGIVRRRRFGFAANDDEGPESSHDTALSDR
jgi:hypothetical protein